MKIVQKSRYNIARESNLYSLSLHAHVEAFVVSAVLASVAVSLVYDTVFVLTAGVL